MERAPEPLVQDVPSRLFITIGRLSRSLRQAGAQAPGHGAISALATLARFGDLRLGDLAAKEGVAAATMSRIVATLVEAGYVRRDPDPSDRRAWRAIPTEEGLRVLSEVRTSRVGELSRRLDQLPAQEHAALVAALPVLESLLAADE